MGCPFGFGELNIPSSRAFWDDCDEDDPTEDLIVERVRLDFVSGQTETALKDPKLMVLIEGIKITDFAENAILKSATKVCTIGKSFGIYNIKNDSVILIVIEEDLTNSAEITELLLPFVERSKNVVTLTVKPKVDYKSENIDQVCDEITFLRGINSQLKDVEELQAPNFIAGVTAGVSSWLENKQQSISSYVAYTDKIPLDSLAANPIIKLLIELGVDCDKSYHPKFIDNSHLYI